MRTLLGCCLIHLCIGSVYALSVLYPKYIQQTGWENDTFIFGFALIILSLGLTASFHQKICGTISKKRVLSYATILWFLAQESLCVAILQHSDIVWGFYVFNIELGFAIGLLYVIPINIITERQYKRMGLASGAVVCCFGLGSILAAQLFHYIELVNLTWIYVVYAVVLIIGIQLIKDTSEIQPSSQFQRDIQWYKLAVIFLFNIGIGISLLSNLTQLSIERGLTMEDAVLLVALAGVSNTLGRLVYSSVSDYIGAIRTLTTMLVLQCIALMLLMYYWTIGIIVVISVYGGVFAIMPSIMKQLYNNSTAYSQILSMWGIAGLIFPTLFNIIGFNMLYILSGALLGIVSRFYVKS